jgi:RNA polymerase sigma factor (sigma-70 family)
MDDLLRNLKSPDQRKRNTAFRSLYENQKIWASVKNLAIRYRLDISEVDEIIQLGIVKLDAKIRNGDFEERSKVETYLIGICKWLVWDKVKKNMKTSSFEITPDSVEEKEFFQSEQYVDMEQNQWETERNQLLRELINQMDDKCRQSITTYYLQEKSMKDVAEERGLANTTQARKALDRCRKKLRAVLKSNPTLANLLNPKS